MRRIVLALLLAMSIAVPIAGAVTKHHLKLKGTVVGKVTGNGQPPAAKISVKQRSKKVGTMTIAQSSCAA